MKLMNSNTDLTFLAKFEMYVYWSSWLIKLGMGIFLADATHRAYKLFASRSFPQTA